MILITAVVVALFVPASLTMAQATCCAPQAQPGCCDGCGCDDMICQLVWETKDVKKTRYCIKCEPHCLAPRTAGFCDKKCGKSCCDPGPCAPACKTGCGDAGCNGPTCKGGCVRMKRKLVKYECTVKECVCKWVVVCKNGCGTGCCGSVGTPVPGETKPAPPTARIGDELLPTPEELHEVTKAAKAHQVRMASANVKPYTPAPVVPATSAVFK